jgi:hypothetical protein
MSEVMTARPVMIVIRPRQGHRRPVRRVGDGVLALRNAMQVHRRQQRDAQTDAEMAKQLRQRGAPTAGVAFSAAVRNAVGGQGAGA